MEGERRIKRKSMGPLGSDTVTESDISTKATHIVTLYLQLHVSFLTILSCGGSPASSHGCDSR